MKNKKIVSIVAGALAAVNVFSFAACQPKNSGTGAVEAYNGGAVTVSFYHTMGANLKAVLDKYIPKFNEQYPNITIDHEMVGDYPALRDQIATELTAGNSPSLAYCYPDHVALYNKAQAVMPMDGYIAHETMGLTDAQVADFIDVYYNEGKSFGDGKMYTLPMTKSTEVLYYNKTFFTANNLPTPENLTWDQMEELCAQIKAIDPNCIPLGYDSEANWFITMTEQLGTPYTSATGTKFQFNTPENRAFVEKYRDWYTKRYVITEEINGGYTSNLFTASSDKTHSYMTIGSSAGASYQCPAPVEGQGNAYPFEVGVAMIPQKDVASYEDTTKAKVISQGPSICLFKKSNAQEVAAAWLFAKFITSTVEFQAEYSMKSGYAPVIQSVQQNPVYQTFLNTADGNANLQASCVKQSIAQMNAYYVSPAFNGSSAARDKVGELIQNCFVNSPAAGQSVSDFVKEQFDSAIDALAYDYGN